MTPIPTKLKWSNLMTCDRYAECKPDVVCDLDRTPWPFRDDSFDEVHAYEVLEHLGRQGDWKSFFDHFGEIHRILKPGGFLCASVPKFNSEGVWGDPSHTRNISIMSLCFLSQDEYRRQLDKANGQMSDFRFYWKRDLAIDGTEYIGDTLHFILKARKGNVTEAPGMLDLSALREW